MLDSLPINDPLILAAILWTIPWKGVALWKAARREDKGWFIALPVINTFALLEALYIFYFSKREKKEDKKPAEKKIKTRSKKN